jgi:peptidoglycan/xylan/chitin deacetylase (PgdA/CDA1 family)
LQLKSFNILTLLVLNATLLTHCKSGLTPSRGCGVSDIGLATAALTGKELPDQTLVLTFNGGPSESTKQISDFLYANGIAATFFVSGENIPGYEAQLGDMKAKGHLIGNLSFTGSDINTNAGAVSSLRKTDEWITPYVSGDIFLLRNAAGDLTKESVASLKKAGLGKYVGSIGWDIGVEDGTFKLDSTCWSKQIDTGICSNQYLEKIKSVKRGIILLHDTDPKTAELLKLVILPLKIDGYKFIRLDSVPSIRTKLLASGAKPGTVGGPAGCQDYK